VVVDVVVVVVGAVDVAPAGADDDPVEEEGELLVDEDCPPAPLDDELP
jgi:hypothetical protein